MFLDVLDRSGSERGPPSSIPDPEVRRLYEPRGFMVLDRRVLGETPVGVNVQYMLRLDNKDAGAKRTKNGEFH